MLSKLGLTSFRNDVLIISALAQLKYRYTSNALFLSYKERPSQTQAGAAFLRMQFREEKFPVAGESLPQVYERGCCWHTPWHNFRLYLLGHFQIVSGIAYTEIIHNKCLGCRELLQRRILSVWMGACLFQGAVVVSGWSLAALTHCAESQKHKALILCYKS